MAKLLETLRNTILTSVHGRRVGLDKDEYLVGPKALAVQIEDIQSTNATTVSAYGHTRVLTSGSSQGPVQHFLPAPVPGVMKTLSLDSTSTGSQQFLSTANGASILAASDGTTKGVLNFLGQGGSAILIGVTTAIWRVLAQASTGGVSYTTST
jgi:hypothetical protein